ncbi:MAG: mechanosensitive ion channel [Campylobacterota bacterium]|nr:mechanosensitive ion channel [Campylobacterota bacterium]
MGTTDLIMAYTLQIVIALAIFVIGKKIARKITDITLSNLSKTGKIDETLEKFLSSVIYGVLLVVVVLAALGQVGVETTSFIAILGAVGLAVGLAFQSTLSNISAGVMIIIFRPIQVGEFVEAGGATGIIEEINIFNTMMRTGDNKVIIVSNSNIIGGNIINYSRKDTRRVDLTFGIGYDDDLKLAKSTLEEILNSDSRILKDKDADAPFVAVSELADSSVNFVTRSWVKSEDYWGVYFDTIEKVKLTFDEKGISIPYPQMDIHMDK